MSENELGAFLRARREAVTPTEVGLPSGSRRRTPGLRRSEVATLAGISVEYLTRLEQGRDRNPSPSVLGSLADTLRLTVEERIHLRRLEKASNGADNPCCAAAPPPALSVRPTVRALVDRLEPTPAVLLNRLSDILTYTTGYERVARPLGLLDGDRPNLLRFVFTDERARAVFPEWDRVADEQIAHLRSESPMIDPHVVQLVDELTVLAGAPFSDRVEAVPGLPRRSGVERLTHPEVGALRLSYETLALPDVDGQRLLVHLPADDATSAALDQLNGRQPGGLRAVSG
ncbi:helix-turn-helix transcriptional regulator [Streptomyces flavofungini]|uniref:Helix-turn-helix domain-containing protein n=1 Tax=Streptomyces flavofungini TaxID=68200 RepID=A0ABS0X367_9ACTN|nr:helix-turn-helix transcriptional regulator [Streptomyces flavofungini]MBJ3807632.1 helix-turn-helix domain-containing protein [Streptomyces flavofungini]GHC64323.1 transcriptional regulator [Streptomyces flavofungini]